MERYITKKLSVLFMIFLACLFFASCVVQRISKITSTGIKPGMSKESVIAIMGMPYKSAFPNKSSSSIELLYYKEQLWVARSHRLIESILTFNNGVLESIEQGQEKRAYTREIEVN